MSNQNKSVTLSPYYRLLLLTSGLVLGASPAQATQPFSPLNMLADGDSTELLVSPSPELNFPGPTSESEAFGSSSPQEIVSPIDATNTAIEVLPPETADMEVGAGNLDRAVDDLASMASIESVKAVKDTASLPAMAQGEQESVATTATSTSPIDQLGNDSPLMAQAPVEEQVEEVEMETTIEQETVEEAPTFTPDAPPTTTEGTPGPTQTLPSFTPPASPSTTTPAPAQDEPRVLVSEVLVTGTTPELELLVYNAIRTQPGRTTTRSQLQEDVNAIYATGYFSNVRVAPSDTPLGVRVTFEVQANPVFTGLNIRTVPEVAEGKERILPQEVVDETFGDQYGKILNLRELQEGIKTINEWYSNQGYDLAQVVGSPQVGADGQVTLVIAEGIVENIQVRFFDSEDEPVEGRTRDFIITREMRLKPGDVFNRNRAQTDLQRVYSLGLFEDVRLSFNPGTDPTEVIVNVDVVEGNTGSIAAGGGISSTSGLFGTISYQEKNLGGNNQTIGVEAQVGQRELLFDVSFTDPWIGGDPFRTSYTANLFRRRTISLVFDGADSSIRTFNGFDSPRVVRTGLGLTFFRPIADDVFSPPDWRLSAGFGYQNVRIENAAGALSPFSAPLNGFNSQPLSFSDYGVDELFTLSFGASQDNRNNALQPTSGSLVRFGAEQTIPVGTGNIMMTRLRGSYSYYIPVNWLDLTGFGFVESTQPQTVAFNVQAGTVLGDLPPYEAFILGGSNSVRGYQEGELGNGRSFFQATAEYRFPIIAAVGGALFVDYGSNLGSQGAVPGFPAIVRGLPGSGVGYGFGVRIQSPVGPIRIDLGFTGEGESRINFGIGEKF
ncbi:BamA/TamA family outer membrane protein [Synechocystis sp. FACHB-383]|nr:BamA/TamA family outer membrane protein [Synechocystis sp. FACHB-383]